MIFNSRNITANPTVVEKHKTAPIGGDTLDMDIADHIEDKEISVPKVGRVFNSNWRPPTEQEAIDADHKSTMDYMKAFISGDKPETDKAFKAIEDHVSQYGDKCTHCKKITGKTSSKVFNSKPLNEGESGRSQKKFNSRKVATTACPTCPEPHNSNIESATDALMSSITSRSKVNPGSFEFTAHNTMVNEMVGQLRDAHMRAAETHIKNGEKELANNHVISSTSLAQEKTKGLPFFVKSEGNRMASFNPKLAEFSIPNRSQESFTPDNSNFKTNFRLNQGPMKTKYLKTINKTGEEPSELADEAFGMGGSNGSGPHPALLGRTLDQFFGIRLRPRVPEGTSIPAKRRIQQESLSINPEFTKIEEGDRRNVDAPFEVTLGHLLKTPSFMVKDENGGTRTLGSTTNPEGQSFDDHPSNALTRGGIAERRLYHEAMGRLSSHPNIKVVDGEVSWTPEAHKTVQSEVEKYKKDVQNLYHGNGATLENGTRVRPLYMSKRAANFIIDVDEHFEPHPEDAEKWQTAITAFGNVTKGSGIRTMTERAHSPWSQMYDTSFQRRVEDSDDTTLKDVFKEHLGEKGQHRYIASAPVGSFSQETENWKTVLNDRLRKDSRGSESGTPELTPTELARSLKPPKTKKQKTFRVSSTPTPINWESTKNDGTTAKKRIFSSKFKKFFFNSSKTK